jgi:hypothetical protein
MDVKPVVAGDVVKVVDESYVGHFALVTFVHGPFAHGHIPSLNVIFVTKDENKVDPYGQQPERLSSLQHLSQGPSSMTKPGRYWENA